VNLKDYFTKGIEKKDLPVFLICFVLALLFWFLTSLSNKFTGETNIRLNYTDYPSDKILLSKPEARLKITVIGSGYYIFLSLMQSRFRPLKLDVLSNISYNDGKGYILTRMIESKIRRHLPSEFILVSVSPDSILFDFDMVIEKMVPVRPNVEYSLMEEYSLTKEIATVPDSITLKGPKTLLDTITSWSTENLHLEDLNHSVNRKLTLIKNSNPFITINYREVALKVLVDRYLDTSIVLIINTDSLANGDVLLLERDTVLAQFQYPSAYEKELSDDLFNVAVSLINDTISNKGFLSLSLSKQPSYIKNVQLVPNTIVYITKDQ